MSYCRFENTYLDLVDCEQALCSGDDLSETEDEYRKKLVRLCIEIAKEHGPAKVQDALYDLSHQQLQVQ